MLQYTSVYISLIFNSDAKHSQNKSLFGRRYLSINSSDVKVYPLKLTKTYNLGDFQNYWANITHKNHLRCFKSVLF